MANWKENGWTCLQEADAEKHVVEVTCRTEDGMVVEVRTRHNDGNEHHAEITMNGEPVALPMDRKTFEKHFKKGEFEIH